MLAESGLYVLNVRIRNALEQVFECVYMHFLDGLASKDSIYSAFNVFLLWGGFFFFFFSYHSEISYLLYHLRHFVLFFDTVNPSRQWTGHTGTSLCGILADSLSVTLSE